MDARCRSILVFAAFTIALVRLVLQAQRRTAADRGARASSASAGEAETDLDPEGWVLVQGERWRARAAEPVAAGEPVVVVSVDGLPLAGPKGGVMSPVMFVLGAVVFWLLLSVKVLNEYERGVIFRLGKVLPRAEGPGPRHRGLAHRPHGAGEPADGRARRAAPGRDHPGQRHA